MLFYHLYVDFISTIAHHPFREQLLRIAKMSLLNSLKNVTAKRPAPVSQIARRRDMLITKLNEQVAYRRVRANAHPHIEGSRVRREKTC